MAACTVSPALIIATWTDWNLAEQHYARYESYEELECFFVFMPIVPRTDQFVASGDND
jgi:hypothetical protein